MTVLQDMMKACTENDLPSSAASVNHMMFLELCEVQKVWDVQWHICQDSKFLYCTAKRCKDGPRVAYVAVSSCKKISVEDIEHWQLALSTDTLTLAVYSADSSMVFYDVTKGLVKPNFAVNVRKEGKLHFPVSSYLKKRLLTEAQANNNPDTS